MAELDKIINCMLSMQRYPWEQGVCAQALYEADREDICKEIIPVLKRTLEAMLNYQNGDGRLRDVMDDPDSFADGASSMMMAAAIYRGNLKGYLDFGLDEAEKAYETVTSKIDEFGLIHEVSGCPDFVSEGTSAEAQAAYIMASAWRRG